MVHSMQCSSVHTLLWPLFFSILLILTSSMEAASSDARRLPLRLLEVGVGKDEDSAIRGEMRVRRALIGSRPPRCERVCMSCGHCEAVQVPIVPQDRRQKTAAAAGAADEEERVVAAVGAAMFTYRVDGITNYKPLSWKCRCGDTILDP
ncbi:EPIDERMAL PATTERNING FACTOR-like protein 2 isoform X2 [Panicum virgatum]|uniref:Epidermal patterning factor-like protein n=1 Tax=Panicum virgatum TaxID=38727 RepID=A0A8T0VXG4_PANVG|nr:EPIDERMAL PATTERNING FACTOR-like protein 2 isoform X2 [Panicum virgatum]KAG2639778.1 hypothetical protein PVAP13_2KG041700 [Panicum virgatum]